MTNAILKKDFTQCLKAWDSWGEVWRGLGITAERDANHGAWADDLQVKISAFLTSWVDACGNTKGVYLHVLQAHVSDMVREYGDISLFSSQGLEHGHKSRKFVAFSMTNFRKKDRTASQMDHIIIMDYIHQHLDSSQFRADYEKNREAQMKCSLRKAKKLMELNMPSEL